MKLLGRLIMLTAIAVIIHQYDLFEQVWRSPLDGRVHRAQQHRQGLIDKDEDYAELRKVWWIWHVSASGRETHNHHSNCLCCFLIKWFTKIYWLKQQPINSWIHTDIYHHFTSWWLNQLTVHSSIDRLTDPSGRKSGIGRVREMRSLR